MLKSTKVKALCCAMALVFAVPVFASASSGTWQNKHLPMWRSETVLTSGTHSSHILHADVKITKNDVGEMWLGIFWPYEGQTYKDTGDCVVNGTTSLSMDYLDNVPVGSTLSLAGGANNPLYSGNTSGSCDFH